MPELGIVGLGRLGSNLAQALGSGSALCYDQKAAQGQASCAQEVIDRSDLLFLALPDDELEAFVARHHWHPGGAVVHTSGALSLDVLEGARRAGALVGSFHPLQSFGPEARWEGIVIGVEGDGPLLERLEALAIRLGATPIPVKERVPYHLAAVMVSNFTTALFGQACRYLGEAGFSPSIARQALLPLLQGTLENLKALPPEEALTGPVARGDGDTLVRHLDFLTEPDSTLYRLLSDLALQLTDQRETPLEPSARRRIAAILAETAEETLCERC